MRTRVFSAAVLIALGMVLSTFSAESGFAEKTGKTKQTTVKTDRIFDHIMESMPTELKTRVDSAATATGKTKESTHRQGAREKETKVEKAAALDHALDELPRDLKEKVNKAMEKIDRQGKQRVLQFKERKGKRSGKKK